MRGDIFKKLGFVDSLAGERNVWRRLCTYPRSEAEIRNVLYELREI
jgi:hypothetical protein